MNLAAVTAITLQLLPALITLSATLARKAHAFDDIVKIGRTHLQDATPLTLGRSSPVGLPSWNRGSATFEPPCPICANWHWGARPSAPA